MARELSDERVRYRFGPLEQRGLIAGWRGGQIIAVAAGLVIAMLSLRSHPTVGGVILALAFVSVGTAVGCWPIRGRTAEQWLPVALHWVGEGLGGGRRRRVRGAGSGAMSPLAGPDRGGWPSPRRTGAPADRGGRPGSSRESG